MQMNYAELPNDRLSLNRWIKNTLGASPGGNEENRPSMGNLSGQDWRQLIQTNPMAAKQAADMANAARDSGGAPMMNYQNEINRLKQQGISFDEPAPPPEIAPPVVNAPPNFGEMFPNQNLGFPNVGDRYGFLDFLKPGGGGQGGGPFQRQVIDNGPQDWGQPGGGGPFQMSRSDSPPGGSYGMSMNADDPYYTGTATGQGGGGLVAPGYTQARSDSPQGGGMPPQFLKVLQQLMSRLRGGEFNPNAIPGMM